MVANDPHNRKPPLLLGFIAMVSGILLALFVISKVNAASEPQYIFYVNGTLYGTNTQRDIWVYPAGILDQSNVVYSYGPANAVQTVYTNVNGNWQESEAPVHLQSTVNFTMVKGTFSYTNYEPEYVDEHFIPLTFDTAYSPKTLVAPCTECSASDYFYNVVYFQDHNSFRWYCYAHNGEIRFCNDNVILVQPSGALWYWETQDGQGDRWVLIDTSHVAVQGTDYLVYRALWIVYSRGSNLVAVTDYSSATIPSWPPTHGGGHSFNDGYITPISNFGYDDTCTIDYLQCTFADATEEEPTPSPSSAPDQSNYENISFVWVSNDEYYFTDISASFKYNVELDNDYSPFVYVRSQYNNYDYIPLLRPAIVWSKNNTANVSIYFSGVSYEYIRIYDIGTSLITDYDYIRQNFDYIDVSNTSGNGSFGDYDIRFDTALQGDFNLYSFSIRKGNWSQNVSLAYSGNIAKYEFNNSYNAFYALNYNSSYASSCPVVYGIELMTDIREDPSLPTPTATPTATPTPTQPPYVIIVTPDPSPTPTPPFVIPTMPPWNPPGNQIVPLDPDTQNNVFGVFKAKLGDNSSFGLIGLLIGLLPDDLMWYLWFLLFILLVVGAAKLIIHFTGG